MVSTMMICCDTSFLFSFYHHDVHSINARKYVSSQAAVISLSPLNRFEFYQALRFAEFSKVLTKERAALLIAAFEKDLTTGYFQEHICNLATILAEAHRLSSLYTLKKGYRAFDIIHVAAACCLDAKIFLTFDSKQRALAKSQGLETPI